MIVKKCQKEYETYEERLKIANKISNQFKERFDMTKMLKDLMSKLFF